MEYQHDLLTGFDSFEHESNKHNAIIPTPVPTPIEHTKFSVMLVVNGMQSGSLAITSELGVINKNLGASQRIPPTANGVPYSAVFLSIDLYTNYEYTFTTDRGEIVSITSGDQNDPKSGVTLDGDKITFTSASNINMVVASAEVSTGGNMYFGGSFTKPSSEGTYTLLVVQNGENIIPNIDAGEYTFTVKSGSPFTLSAPGHKLSSGTNGTPTNEIDYSATYRVDTLMNIAVS